MLVFFSVFTYDKDSSVYLKRHYTDKSVLCQGVNLKMSSAREKILEVAGGLFFQYGYRAIGIDMIIAESQIAKATLYRHFKSKDDLIVAYLQDMNRQFWVWFDGATAPHDDPKD